MYKLIFIFLIVQIALFGCAKQNEKSNTIIPKKHLDTLSIITDKKVIITNTKNPSIIVDKPCNELLSFVIDIEKIDLRSDTIRLKKVNIYNEINRENVHLFRNRPFYKMTFEKTKIFKAQNNKPYKNYFSQKNITDFKIFNKVKTIWGFFYRAKLKDDSISDGVIEQWTFETRKEALKALNSIKKHGYIVFFNTMPFFSTIENKLIIFHTRAMGFSYDQKIIFKQFKDNYLK
jgi:hypothetical protein